MCGCKHHWDTNAPCTCKCPEHAAVRREMARREQCSPPQPGDIVWRGNVRGYIGSDWEWHVAPGGTPAVRLRDLLADAVFCTECLCLRIDPRHWARKGLHS